MSPAYKEMHANISAIYIVCTCTEPKITSGQRSISVQTTERTAQMITRPVIMTGRPPGEYSALIIHVYAIARCPYGASAAIDRSISYVRTYMYIYIYIYIYTCTCIHHRSMRRRMYAYTYVAPFPGSSLLPRNNFKKGGRSLGRLRRVEGVRVYYIVSQYFSVCAIPRACPEKREGN